MVNNVPPTFFTPLLKKSYYTGRMGVRDKEKDSLGQIFQSTLHFRCVLFEWRLVSTRCLAVLFLLYIIHDILNIK